MKHLFIPYSLALIAKEKGFDEPCFSWYLNKKLEMNPNDIFYFTHSLRSHEGYKSVPRADYVSAPIYQQIIDWMREKHRIFIMISTTLNGDINGKFIFHYGITKLKPKEYKASSLFTTYYEALNKAIEHAFILI